MIVSALLTSVGINFGLCVLFFALYSILRKQPVNYNIYVPRLVAEDKSRTSYFNIGRLLPTPEWMGRAWKPTEDEILSSSGLDAVVFMRIITFSLKVFTLAGIIGVFILLPVNCTGDQLQDINFANLTSNSLDVFTISNVNNGSKRLWIHFCAVYVLTIFICYLLYYEYKYISSKRIAYFDSSKPQPHQFTILVHSIPVSAGGSISNNVQSFFMEYHPTTYLSHLVVQKTYIFSNLAMRKEVQAAFVSFKSRYGAAMALHLQQSDDPTEWVTEQAPEPHDVYWPFFSSSFMLKWILNLVVIVAYVLLTILFFIPVLIVQGLNNLSQLEVLFPFLTSILKITFVSQVVTGYLPNLLLQLFLKMTPPVMKFLSSIQGFPSPNFNCLIITSHIIIIIVVIIIYLVIISVQASFFIAYVVTSGWASTSSELFRLIPLIWSLLRKPFSEPTTDEFEAPSFSYHWDIPRVLFFCLLGIIYFFLAPLILPFLLVYFCLGYIIYRNQFINVYAPKYETGGKYWPIVHNSIIFSLVLMHALAVGIFTLKRLSLASSLMFPLPVMTLLFNAYCRKRFLPIFTAFSAQRLIKKDIDDSSDPELMAEFFSKLVIAYQEPASSPLDHSTNCDSETYPLLSPTQF
ncbi:CSC1-like protein At1g69450 [Olea europaea var. sylvestris]|uniref:CSC1-like protein At1g69450 n=1 Tax=Olea europaea var. sylvestris TaxID=158386 RepID=UPI000C1D0654|nr:CSC1-like protein At1g69450 [Olea europaea var. sylvestris]